MTDTIATVFATVDTTTPPDVARLRARGQIAWLVSRARHQDLPDVDLPDVYDNTAAPHLIAARLAARAATDATDDDMIITAAITATAVAVGAHVNATLASAIDAVVSGHDVATRLVRTLTGHTDYDVTFVAAVLGATTTANTLVNKTLAVRLHAYGIASTQAARLTKGPYDTPHARAEDAADTAVEAALLASHGFTGPLTGIDGRRGVVTVIAEHAPVAQLHDPGGVPVGVSFDAAHILDGLTTLSDVAARLDV